MQDATRRGATEGRGQLLRENTEPGYALRGRIFISRSVRRHPRWASAIAAIAYLIPSAPWLLRHGGRARDALTELPAWYSTVQTSFAIVYLLLGICAAFLLIASSCGRAMGEAATSNEAG